MYEVVKRNGTIVPFDRTKISTAITKAFTSVSRPINPDGIEWLTMRAIANAEMKVANDKLTVEDIQDSVEDILGMGGYHDVAKAYVLYRDQHKRLRNAKDTLLNYRKTMEDYLHLKDWRVKENSTISYSLGGLILSNSGAITANYWLSEIYDEEIADAHRSCRIHLHDLSMLSPYCAGWNLKQLIEVGLVSINGKMASNPASHLSALCNQMVNFLGILQNEWAG